RRGAVGLSAFLNDPPTGGLRLLRRAARPRTSRGPAFVGTVPGYLQDHERRHDGPGVPAGQLGSRCDDDGFVRLLRSRCSPTGGARTLLLATETWRAVPVCATPLVSSRPGALER